MTSLPKTYRKLTVRKFSSDFRSAVSIDRVDLCKPKDGEICVKNRFVGVNAFDINNTKGHHWPNDTIPFSVGLEGIGEVVQVGNGVRDIKVGDGVAYCSVKRNAYGEYSCFPAEHALKVPDIKPEYIAILLGGLTAAVGLDENAKIKKGETVLITSAAGGVGHIAVQWAKAAGCHVIGTCSTEEKEKLLKSLWCDRIINYKKEDLGEVLSKEYPKGIDLIWETIGGPIFETCVENIAVNGRLIVVGGISGYKQQTRYAFPKFNIPTLPETLLFRNAALQGFLLPEYMEYIRTYFNCMLERVKCGMLKPVCNYGMLTPFEGMEGIIDGVEYLNSGKNIGKVAVKIS